MHDRYPVFRGYTGRKEVKNQMMDKNREILGELKKYLPEGCIHDGDHISVRGSG